MMVATINKMDPIEKRMQRGRKIARNCTLAVLLGVGLTAALKPSLFSTVLSFPTEEEREKAKSERKKKRSNKPKSRLTQKDIEKLAKLRKQRARKHLIEILVRLEARILIAEAKEKATTAAFREEANLFPALQRIVLQHAGQLSSQVAAQSNNAQAQMRNSGGYKKDVMRTLGAVHSQSYRVERSAQNYQKDPSAAKLAEVLSATRQIETLMGDQHLAGTSYDYSVQTRRYLTSILSNLKAIETQDRDFAVRGFAQPEDHPLDQSQRKNVRSAVSSMPTARLHQLSQEMAEYYSNLMGDVDAGELAKAAEIPFPEALEKLAHEPYAKDDLEDALKPDMPMNEEQLDTFTEGLEEGKGSAEKALEAAGGTVPGAPGDGPPGEDGLGGDKSGDAEEGEGLFGSGGGNGTENSNKQGPPSSFGQITDEKILRSLALASDLSALQDREVAVDGNIIYAKVLPARRFAKNSKRKGSLFIDTWHIIGPWDAQVDHRKREINFSKIYGPERKLDLDAVYSTGKKARIYDDERGYGTRIPEPMDGRLEWQFYQSPTVEVRIPHEQLANDATYFAYTEVFFEEETTLTVMIGTDDASAVRVNGKIISKDTGLSPYKAGEHSRKVTFKKGVNKILVRLVNGTGPCRFSLLLTP